MNLKDQVLSLYNAVKTKQAAIDAAASPKFITNGEITIDPQIGLYCNIKNANEYEITQVAIPFLLRMKQSNDYLKSQGLKTLKLQNRDVEDFLKDSTLRLNMLQSTDLQTELDKRKSVLDRLLKANPEIASEIDIAELSNDEFLSSGIDVE